MSELNDQLELVEGGRGLSMFLEVAGLCWSGNAPGVDGQGRHSLTVKGGGAMEADRAVWV